MKKYIMPVILCIFIGFLLSKFMLNQYQNKQKITPVFNTGETLYFIQYGVYSSEESMKNNTDKLNYYIYNLENNMYYVFIGITKSIENVSKLQGYFKNLGYDTYMKEYNVSDSEFLEMISYYDQLLSATTDYEVMKSVSRQVLEKYEESIKNER
ncbi:MAG: hypothetical protein PHI05_04935 [Bacilli bacterium]|nr:hypothetical protein [Bacilli bacterium]MDD4548066.1 hypothetical protein [Bacilli bacterium]